MTGVRNKTIAFVTTLAALIAAHGATACMASDRASVAGPVLDVPSDGVICVALGPRPEQWVKVRLAKDGAGTEALDRKRLMAAAFSKRVDCARESQRGWTCRLGADDLAALAGSSAIGLASVDWH
ncbi:hypothetical protein [Caulobacter sp.]|jgi:hypothetical protein|uniref:hypothetical protein n=1 Tax=Caulobacter sp. TaxID=78 RepID=UPI0016213210